MVPTLGIIDLHPQKVCVLNQLDDLEMLDDIKPDLVNLTLSDSYLSNFSLNSKLTTTSDDCQINSDENEATVNSKLTTTSDDCQINSDENKATVNSKSVLHLVSSQSHITASLEDLKQKDCSQQLGLLDNLSEMSLTEQNDKCHSVSSVRPVYSPSVSKSKDSGLPLSLSRLSLRSTDKSYENVQSKVKEYISNLKEAGRHRNSTQSSVKENVCYSSDDWEYSEEIKLDPHELLSTISTLRTELQDKDEMLRNLQDSYSALLMLHAETKNRIDQLRFDTSKHTVNSQDSIMQNTGHKGLNTITLNAMKTNSSGYPSNDTSYYTLKKRECNTVFKKSNLMSNTEIDSKEISVFSSSNKAQLKLQPLGSKRYEPLKQNEKGSDSNMPQSLTEMKKLQSGSDNTNLNSNRLLTLEGLNSTKKNILSPEIRLGLDQEELSDCLQCSTEEAILKVKIWQKALPQKDTENEVFLPMSVGHPLQIGGSEPLASKYCYCNTSSCDSMCEESPQHSSVGRLTMTKENHVKTSWGSDERFCDNLETCIVVPPLKLGILSTDEDESVVFKTHSSPKSSLSTISHENNMQSLQNTVLNKPSSSTNSSIARKVICARKLFSDQIYPTNNASHTYRRDSKRPARSKHGTHSSTICGSSAIQPGTKQVEMLTQPAGNASLRRNIERSCRCDNDVCVKCHSNIVTKVLEPESGNMFQHDLVCGLCLGCSHVYENIDSPKITLASHCLNSLQSTDWSDVKGNSNSLEESSLRKGKAWNNVLTYLSEMEVCARQMKGRSEAIKRVLLERLAKSASHNSKTSINSKTTS
ncbi:unnamed protein product [Timema podura]|uniref:Uncharacterized protein n=1 Tax=Timema podura TaxID=61482 RepID=A0ABN7NNJ5_TIMPD|nr:unnamed protein product [Timema podura]